uniref:Uncharacterized protein n=1 Tax=Anguilla anguilla TaxID=7936 RepID=A0A0E9P8Q8_ANGAN
MQTTVLPSQHVLLWKMFLEKWQIHFFPSLRVPVKQVIPSETKIMFFYVTLVK